MCLRGRDDDCSQHGCVPCRPPSETGYPIPRHLEYSFTLQNTTNRVIDQAELWTYAPVTLTAGQQRVHLEASHPFQAISDDLGNSILYFTFHHLPPYAAKILTIRVDLLLSETPHPRDVPHTSRLRNDLQPEPYCESDDPRD